MNTGERLKYWRQRAKATQEDIAKILKTSRPQYARYETEVHELPLRHAITLAKFYGISLDELIGMKDD